MPIGGRLVSVADPEEGGLVERFGAELDAEGQGRRASRESARQHDGGNSGHVGEVVGVGARWQRWIGRDIGAGDFGVQPGGGVTGWKHQDVAGLEDPPHFLHQNGAEAQGLDVVDGGMEGGGFEAFTSERLEEIPVLF